MIPATEEWCIHLNGLVGLGSEHLRNDHDGLTVRRRDSPFSHGIAFHLLAHHSGRLRRRLTPKCELEYLDTSD